MELSLMDFVYTPSDQLVRETNLMRFAEEIGIGTVRELYDWADSKQEDFWNHIVENCEIKFFSSYAKVVDLSSGKENAKWFTDGKLNIVYNTVEKYALDPLYKDRAACKYERESGERGSITFSDLDEMTAKLGSGLLNLGVRKRDRIGIYLPLSLESVIALYAVMRIGAIAVPIFSGYGSEAVEARVKDAGITAVITCKDYERKGRRINQMSVIKDIPGIKKIVVGLTDPGDGEYDFYRLISEGDYISSVPMNSEDPAIMLYTSGTTGKPKGTVHVHGGSFVNIVKEVKFYMDMKPDDTLFWISDPGWMMGPWSIIGANALGGSILVYDGAVDYPDSDRIFSLVEHNHVTLLGLSPTFVRMMKAKGISRNISGVRVFGSTGEPWDTDSWMYLFETLGSGKVPIANISGGTDIIGCFLASTPAIPLKPKCLYRGLGMNVSVFDEDGTEIYNKIGHLVSREACPSMTRGIWKQPDKYMETYWSRFPGSWSQGDWAEMDDDGYFFLYGRSDDVIKVAGKRVGPGEVEDMVNAVPGVVESAVVGIPDPIKGESIGIFYTGNDSIETTGSIRREVEGNLGKSFSPKYVICLPSLPKTRNGKIMRRIVRNAFLGNPVGDISNLEDTGIVDLLVNLGRSNTQWDKK
jgi:acetyl-CoA synthetase